MEQEGACRNSRHHPFLASDLTGADRSTGTLHQQTCMNAHSFLGAMCLVPCAGRVQTCKGVHGEGKCMAKDALSLEICMIAY